MNISSATEADCVAFTEALRLTKKKNRPWAKEWYKTGPQYAQEKCMKHLRPSESKEKKNVLQLDDRSFEELLEICTPTIAKSRKQSLQSVFFITLRYMATTCRVKPVLTTCVYIRAIQLIHMAK